MVGNTNFKTVLQLFVARLQILIVKSYETPGFDIRPALLSFITDVILYLHAKTENFD